MDFLFADESALEYDPALLVQKKSTAEDTRQILARSIAALEALPGFATPAIEEALRPLPDELGMKAREFFGTLRIACTGKEVAPPLFESLAILGREATLKRLKNAQALLGAAS